jgi:hypothetical protein
MRPAASPTTARAATDASSVQWKPVPGLAARTGDRRTDVDRSLQPRRASCGIDGVVVLHGVDRDREESCRRCTGPIKISSWTWGYGQATFATSSLIRAWTVAGGPPSTMIRGLSLGSPPMATCFDEGNWA